MSQRAREDMSAASLYHRPARAALRRAEPYDRRTRPVTCGTASRNRGSGPVTPNPASRVDRCYWIGVAGAPNGSVGAAPPVSCQIVLPAFTANERVPVVPIVCGIAVA